eukprot:TRINITY_DN22328_c0_g1_i3.p1 TRINITY_DN22328_c0_g1~~TRINITY_DN22328_c0_g1_i3.p1  ORF type:complete len:481 (+),score=126.52 TRINITY_DN22328_c0_g1_i3:67-1509(+)
MCIRDSLYGKIHHPVGLYQPVYLRTKGSEGIHPRTRLADYFKTPEAEGLAPEDVEFYVTVRRSNNMILTQDHRDWIEKAFGPKRNIMKCMFFLFPNEALIKKNFDYYVKLNYSMYPELSLEFRTKDYEKDDIPLKRDEEKKEMFIAELSLPFGDIRPEPYYLDGAGKKVRITNEETARFKEDVVPKTYSQSELLRIETESLEEKTKLAESTLTEKEEAKKSVEMGRPSEEALQTDQLCPFSIATLWSMVDINWLPHEDSEKVKKIVDKYLTSLYQIFAHYASFYKQVSSKETDFCISWQDLMHILKFYEVTDDGQKLLQLLEFCSFSEKVLLPQESLSLRNGLEFPEFVSILLKSANYLKNVNMNEGEGYDEVLLPVFAKMEMYYNDDERITEFHRHMRYSEQLHDTLLEYSALMRKLFSLRLMNTIDMGNKHFMIKKDDVSLLIQETGFTGENREEIVNTCFAELFPCLLYTSPSPRDS